MSKTLWFGVLALLTVAAFVTVGVSTLRAADKTEAPSVVENSGCGCANKGNCQAQADCGCGCNGGGGCGRVN